MSESNNVPIQKMTIPAIQLAEIHFPRILNTLGTIPTSYKESMDFYENLAWLCKYLEETVVPAVNQNGKAVQELQNLYSELKYYVDNYFESENFTERIQERLNEMVQDGTLENLLSTIVDDRIGDFQQTLDETVREVNENMETLTETVNGFDGRIEAVENDVKDLNDTTIPDIQQDVSENSQKITDLETSVDSQNYKNLKRFIPKEKKLKTIAHRGSSNEVPENTAWAFITAGRQGFWGCEADIRECSTGEFVCMHDDTVDRMTNGTGAVSELTYSYLQSLRIDGGNKFEDYPNQTICSLYRYLEICNEYGMTPVIELKAMTNVQAFYDIVKKYGMLYKSIYISFNLSLLQALMEIDPELQCMLLGNMTEANMNVCVQNKFIGISCPYDDLSEILLQQAHSMGLEVACYVVDNNSNNQSLVNILCDYTTLDSMDYYSTLNSKVLKIVNGIKLYNEKDLIYAEGGQFLGGILGGFIKRANFPSITSGTDLDDMFSTTTINRVISTMIVPIKQNSKVAYECDSDSRFSILSFDKNGKFLGDLGWIASGTAQGEYTESRNSAFAILEFSNVDNSVINDVDIKRFSRIVKSVTL